MILPLVSIIINNHNYARFLPAAIDSALRQTYPNVQVIAVDDGSTDESGDILRGYSERIEIVTGAGRAKGQASAMNIGMEKARGEFVFFLDADDLLDEQAVEKVIAHWKDHPEVVHLFFQMEIIDGQGSRSGQIKPDPRIPVPCGDSGDLRELTLACAYDIPWMPTSGNAFRSQPLRKLFPIPEADYFPVGADWYLNHLSNLLGPVGFLPQVLSFYRVHASNRYELSFQTINLQHIRQSIDFAQKTNRHLLRLAIELGIGRKKNRIFSTSEVANRLISLKLDRLNHPIPADSTFHLCFSGIQTVLQRPDITFIRKMVMAAWFIGLSLAPRRLAESLALLYLYPGVRHKPYFFHREIGAEKKDAAASVKQVSK